MIKKTTLEPVKLRSNESLIVKSEKRKVKNESSTIESPLERGTASAGGGTLAAARCVDGRMHFSLSCSFSP